jgi:hypothetical protein
MTSIEVTQMPGDWNHQEAPLLTLLALELG